MTPKEVDRIVVAIEETGKYISYGAFLISLFLFGIGLALMFLVAS